ncbi:MAG: hypothetical protein MI919_28245, partial [Holophagales bacterium]|nr:hypothetical protein [Holophagales bacterium]
TASALAALAFASLVLALPSVAAGAGNSDSGSSEFSTAIEKAHGGGVWQQKSAITANISVTFGGNEMLSGRMWTDTPVGRTRFELVDGTVLVFDGRDAWTSPADSGFQGTRFHALTWPYFLAAPFKLDDPGAHLEELGERPFQDGRSLPAARLTFGEGVGDSPEDWYVVYRDSKSRLVGMAYIVTFGKSTEEAEKEPHAVLYRDYVDVEGVSISTRWTFWNWSAEKGIFGDPIGEVKLSHPRFVDPPPEAFQRPGNARREASPGS